MIGKLTDYNNLEELIIRNKRKIKRIRSDFIHGKLPEFSRKCAFIVRLNLIKLIG